MEQRKHETHGPAETTPDSLHHALETLAVLFPPRLGINVEFIFFFKEHSGLHITSQFLFSLTKINKVKKKSSVYTMAARGWWILIIRGTFPWAGVVAVWSLHSSVGYCSYAQSVYLDLCSTSTLLILPTSESSSSRWEPEDHCDIHHPTLDQPGHIKYVHSLSVPLHATIFDAVVVQA